MIKANTTIIAGDKIFKKGQTVKGLSQNDKSWMIKAGYITEIKNKKETAVPEMAEETANEF